MDLDESFLEKGPDEQSISLCARVRPQSRSGNYSSQLPVSTFLASNTRNTAGTVQPWWRSALPDCFLPCLFTFSAQIFKGISRVSYCPFRLIPTTLLPALWLAHCRPICIRQFNAEHRKNKRESIEQAVSKDNLAGLIKQIKLPHHIVLAVKLLTRFLGDEFSRDRSLGKN